jgi:hypothetical protein
MSKDQEIDLSTTAANNQDFGGVNTAEGMAPSDVNNAMRYLAKMRADAITRHVAKSAGTYTAAKTDHNQFWRCTGAVTINLTAAATLTSGWCLWVRANGGAVTIDPNSTENINGSATAMVLADGQTALILCTGTAFFTVMGGAGGGAVGVVSSTDNTLPRFDGTIGKLQTSGVTVDDGNNVTGVAALTCTALTSTGIDDNATGERLQLADTVMTLGPTSAADYFIGRVLGTGSLTIGGDASSAAGASLTLYGGSHATLAGDFSLSSAGGPNLYLDASANQFIFVGNAALGGATRLGQNTTDAPGNGNNTVGGGVPVTGELRFSTAGTHTLNRTADGNILAWNSGGVAQGVVSCAGAVVTYGAFFGSHWSQLSDGSKPNIPRGTICESIDEMCEWPGEGNEERLPRFKVSDTPGSKAVYGIFAWWDDKDGGETNDAYIGSLGAYVIRIAKGVTVQCGDYIESNGDGCGRVQADDVLRSSTVGKVSVAVVIETYPDGSYLVPCTLHCG